ARAQAGAPRAASGSFSSLRQAFSCASRSLPLSTIDSVAPRRRAGASALGFERLDSRQLPPFEVLQSRTATGRDMTEARRPRMARKRRRGVAPADHAENAGLVGQCLAHSQRAVGEGGQLEVAQ